MDGCKKQAEPVYSDEIEKVAKQATEMAEANVAAATDTVKGMAKPKKAA